MNFEYTILKELISPVKKWLSESEYRKCPVVWCQNIYAENDRLVNIQSNGIRQLENGPDEQLYYMNGNIRMLEHLKLSIPVAQVKFEQRFIADNIDLLTWFPEVEREAKNPAYLIRI